jgi:transposase-like protein
MSRPTILTQAVLARVASLVDNGRSAAEIASEIGCTLGTLRVRCSQHGISLRRATGRRGAATTTINLGALADANAAAQRKPVDRVNTVDQSRTVVSESSVEVRAELKVLLPLITTEQLRQRGALRGISGSTLASELLVTIARDGLYDAVLDGS